MSGEGEEEGKREGNIVILFPDPKKCSLSGPGTPIKRCFVQLLYYALNTFE